jgi:hypothetical protein
MTTLVPNPKPVSARPFFGLGAQSDGYLYDSANASFGVTPEDCELSERRLASLRLANTRMFVDVGTFNPSFDGVTLTWDNPAFCHFLAQLKRHQQNGTLANLVMFQPTRPPVEQIPGVVTAMVSMIEHVVTVHGCDNVRWLTLWNEPDSLFPLATPLMQRVFGAEKLAACPDVSYYEAAVRQAQTLLQERELPTRIAAVDCVWGAQVRRERMAHGVQAFAGIDVDFAYHNYNPEDPAYYAGNPDYAYDGMAAEAAHFRELVGPDAALLLTEFNAVGDGFGSYFGGCSAAGVEVGATVEGAVMVVDKVMKAAANGVDGFTLWCLQDMAFCGSARAGIMPMGLWRYKHQSWLPRPTYHYFGALIAALRPGMTLHAVHGGDAAVTAVAARGAGVQRLLIQNRTGRSATVAVDAWKGGQRQRVIAADIPAVTDLPSASSEAWTAGDRLMLQPYELTILECASADC